MNRIALLLILTFTVFSCLPKSSEKPCTAELIPELETELRNLYNKDAPAALKVMHELQFLYTCSNAVHHKIANTYLNMGSLYEEKLNNLDSSIHFLTKADSVFQAANDSMGWANILKYQGLIEVRNGNEKGLSRIIQGKDLYEHLNFMQGRMVAQQNEANAQLHLNELEIADSLLMPCLQFWNGKHLRWQSAFYDLMKVHEKMNNCTLWNSNKELILSYTDMLSVENKDKLEELSQMICD